MFLIICMVFIVIMMVLAGFVYFKVLRVVDEDQSQSDHINNASTFIPIKSFNDNMVELPNNKFRAILKIDDVNYMFRDEAEQADLEQNYASFLNSLTLPVQFFRMTEMVDVQDYLDRQQRKMNRTTDNFPYLEGYARSYYDFLTKVNRTQQDRISQTKSNYLVVIYDKVSSSVMPNGMSKDKRRAKAAKDLYETCLGIQRDLQKAGIGSKILTTQKLVELFTKAMNPDDSELAKKIIESDEFGNLKSDFRKLYVGGVDLNDTDYNQTMIRSLEAAKNILNVGIIDNPQQPPKSVADRTMKLKEYLNTIQENIEKHS